MKEKKNPSLSLRYLIFSALFAALICIFTAYIGHIPIGMNGGYLHFGDALIFLAASLLPTPYALIASAVGAGMADLLCAPNWVIPTVIIKSLMTLFFTYKKNKILCKQNYLALIPPVILTIGGYYVAEAVMYGNWVTPMFGVVGNVIQSLGSIAIFIILGVVLDRVKIKEKVLK